MVEGITLELHIIQSTGTVFGLCCSMGVWLQLNSAICILLIWQELWQQMSGNHDHICGKHGKEEIGFGKTKRETECFPLKPNGNNVQNNVLRGGRERRGEHLYFHFEVWLEIRSVWEIIGFGLAFPPQMWSSCCIYRSFVGMKWHYSNRGCL